MPTLGDLLMKKSLLALAVLGAFAGAAQAQSSVTVYGVIDGGIRHQTNTDAAGNSSVAQGDSAYKTNRLGFRGTEDLGGGLNAFFTLESEVNPSNGTFTAEAGKGIPNQLFARGAFVGVGGAWGAVSLGHQFSVAWKTLSAYDPMGITFTGVTRVPAEFAGSSNSRLNNDVQYNGTFGPVTVRAEYALGEAPGGAPSYGSTQALGATYAAGPFSVGGAYSQRKSAVGAANADFNHWTLGGTYTFGAFRAAVGYADQTQQRGATADLDTKFVFGGLSYNVTPALKLSGAVYRTQDEVGSAETGKRTLYIASAAYALSKRTELYAELDRSSLDGTRKAFGHDSQRGVSVGVSHSF
jgi:predicted porin